MIRLVAADIQMQQYTHMDVHAIMIHSLYESYGLRHSFLQFWVQEQEGSTTAFMSKIDGVVTLSFRQDADKQELNLFLNAIGFAILRCSGEFECIAPFEEGLIMQKYYCTKNKAMFDITPQCRVQDVLRLNQQWLNTASKDAWYADVSHRIRHGTVQAFGVRIKEVVMSTALLTIAKERYAVISCLATQPDQCGRGLATALLAKVTQEEAKEYYLLCEQEKELFYNNNGFKSVGNWRYYYK